MLDTIMLYQINFFLQYENTKIETKNFIKVNVAMNTVIELLNKTKEKEQNLHVLKWR